MRRYFRILAFASLLAFAAASASFGIPYFGTVDLSGLTPGTSFELEFQLLGCGDVFDAEVLIDNIFIGTPVDNILIDFEDGTLGGFMQDTYNAVNTVRNVPGTLIGAGNKVLSLIEHQDPNGVCTTIVYQSFGVPAVPGILRFDYETIRFEAGSLDDQFTVWLRCASGDPLLIPGVAYANDPVVAEVTTTYGTQTNPCTTCTPIPEPATILLMLSGLGGMAVYGKMRFRRRKR